MKSPLYIQVKNWIIERIKSGDFVLGQKIPTELELETKLGVSRGTIREAFRELINEGYVIRIPGKGTFIKTTEKDMWSIETLVSVADAFDQKKYSYTTKIIDIRIEKADSEVALKLKLKHDSDIICLERIRSIDGRPVHLSSSFIPLELGLPLFKENLENKSLYKVMDEILGIKIEKVERILFARLADTWETTHLDLPRISAILVLSGIAFNSLGVPIESSIARFSSENYKFVIQSKKISKMDEK